MSYPVCLVEIFGQREFYSLRSDVSIGGYGKSPASDLVSCRTDKRISHESPSGTFEIMLTHGTDTRGRSWADKISRQDLVVIQMMNYSGKTGAHGAGEMHTVMIGFVSDVTEAAGVTQQGIPQRNIRVRGLDAGKLFARGMVTYWSFLGATLLGAAEFLPLTKINDQPHQVTKSLIEDIFFRFLKLEFQTASGPIKFWDMLSYALSSYQSLFPGGLDWQFVMAEGSFWSYFVKIASPPFHEVWLDTRRGRDLRGLVEPFADGGSITAKDLIPVAEGFLDIDEQVPIAGSGKRLSLLLAEGGILKQPDAQVQFGQDHSSPTLVLRQPPFPVLLPDGTVDTTVWNSLRTHVVGDSDVLGEPSMHSITQSDHEVYNLFAVFPKGSIIPEKQWLLYFAPILDTPRFRKYGYRPLIPQVHLFKMPESDSVNDSWLKFYEQMSWRLTGWYVLNDQYWSGTKTMRLSPHLHVGEKLVDRATWHHSPKSQSSAAKEFYIEMVGHEFVQNQYARTTIGVTRGLPLEDARNYETILQNEYANNLEALGTSARDRYKELLGFGQRAPS